MTNNHEYPNMLGEVLDAIHEMYVDYPYIEADCYLYLRHALGNEYARIRCCEKLTNMNRCPDCGHPLETYTYYETHYEVSPPAREQFTEKICPECMGVNDYDYISEDINL